MHMIRKFVWFSPADSFGRTVCFSFLRGLHSIHPVSTKDNNPRKDLGMQEKTEIDSWSLSSPGVV